MIASIPRWHALDILDAGLKAVDPGEALNRALSLRGSILRAGPHALDLDDYHRVLVVGAGKAGAPMAQALEEILGERLEGGLMVVKEGHGGPTQRVRLLEAGHPLPDARGQAAGREMAALLARADARTLVICLLSGGGSALLVAPAPGLALEDKQETTRLLLASGAEIGEINAVRKHLSQLKGGGLARLAAPATVLGLIISDVVGDRLDVIASGPTVGDSSTWAEVAAILARYGLENRVPPAVRRRLEQGLAGELEDTPKPGAPLFGRVRNLVVAGNRQALLAAMDRAKELGYAPLLLSSSLTGQAREVGGVLAALAREVRGHGHPLPPPCCILAGGETTVILGDNPGRGGRNQELALAAALGMEGLENLLCLSAGSDGNDGPTDAAGALADGSTLARAKELGLTPRRHLEGHDAYPFFQALGDLLITGPTRTNVMDIMLLLVG